MAELRCSIRGTRPAPPARTVVAAPLRTGSPGRRSGASAPTRSGADSGRHDRNAGGGDDRGAGRRDHAHGRRISRPSLTATTMPAFVVIDARGDRPCRTAAEAGARADPGADPAAGQPRRDPQRDRRGAAVRRRRAAGRRGPSHREPAGDGPDRRRDLSLHLGRRGERSWYTTARSWSISTGRSSPMSTTANSSRSPASPTTERHAPREERRRR